MKKPSYPRKEALQPMKRKVGLASDKDGAQIDKETGTGPQRKIENGPRKGVEASEITWVHLSPSGDDSISLNGKVHRLLSPHGHSTQSLVAQFDELNYSAEAMQPKSQISSGYSSQKASAPRAQQLSLTSSTTLYRPRSLRVRSAQAIQPTWPQRPKPSSSV